MPPASFPPHQTLVFINSTTVRHLIAYLALLMLTASIALGADTYLDAGVAATDREWRAADYKEFMALVTAKKIPLPLLSDEQGAKVLKRFCSPENLAFARNTTLPLNARLPDFLDSQSAVASLLKLFMAKALNREKVGGEASLLLSYNLQLASVGIELVDEFLPTIKHDDTYESRMEGLKRMKSGLATMFAGCYQSVAEDDIYTNEQRSDLLASIAQTAPRFATALSADLKAEMTLKFTKLNEKLKEPRDRESIASILKSIGR